MKLSVVIITRNEENRISICLDSLLRSYDKTNMEILVVDGQSTDKTVAIVKKYSEVKLIQCDMYGYSYQRNIGVENSIGEYVVFVSGDTYVSKSFLERYLYFANEQYDIVQGNIVSVSKESIFSHSFKRIYRDIYPVRAGHFNDQISTVNIMIKREYLLKRRFNSEINSLEDKEWYYAFSKTSDLKVKFSPTSILYHIIHESLCEYCRKIYKEAKVVATINHDINDFNCFNWIEGYKRKLRAVLVCIIVSLVVVYVSSPVILVTILLVAVLYYIVNEFIIKAYKKEISLHDNAIDNTISALLYCAVYSGIFIGKLETRKKNVKGG